MKKWAVGVWLIIMGVLISFGISVFIVEGEFFMLRPGHKNILLAGVFGTPMVIYVVFYGIWYHRCAIQKSRSMSVYKGEMFWVLLAVMLDIIALLVIFEIGGVLDEAWIHVVISSIISTVFFCIAFLCCKPF